MDAVELRSLHGHAVEDRVVDAVHCDPVRAADDGHVLDLDIVVRNDDAAVNDGARLALEHLALPDHERTLVDACAQIHHRREPHDIRRGRAAEREDDRDS